MQKTTLPILFDYFRCHDIASLYIPSPNVFWGLYVLGQCILLGRCVPLTMRHLNDAFPGRCVPYQCVPTMDHIQVVDNHNSNSSFAHANSTHRLPLQSWPNLSLITPVTPVSLWRVYFHVYFCAFLLLPCQKGRKSYSIVFACYSTSIWGKDYDLEKRISQSIWM